MSETAANTNADRVLALRPEACCTRAPSDAGWKVYDRARGAWVTMSMTHHTREAAWAEALERLTRRETTA